MDGNISVYNMVTEYFKSTIETYYLGEKKKKVSLKIFVLKPMDQE